MVKSREEYFKLIGEIIEMGGKFSGEDNQQYYMFAKKCLEFMESLTDEEIAAVNAGEARYRLVKSNPAETS